MLPDIVEFSPGSVSFATISCAELAECWTSSDKANGLADVNLIFDLSPSKVVSVGELSPALSLFLVILGLGLEACAEPAPIP
jgi:hypothetical protein